MVYYSECEVKSVLTRTKIEGADYTVNPYIGCAHGCAYCYARVLYADKIDPLRWGEWVCIKRNAVEILRAEVRKVKPGRILLSTATDPYQPIEAKIELTRRILEVLKSKGFSVSVLTKSPLVVRDFEILDEQDEVGISVAFLDSKISSVMEPRAGRPIERFKALSRFPGKKLVLLAPFLPIISEEDVEEILARAKEVGARVVVDKLNLKGRNWESIDLVFSKLAFEHRKEFWARAKSTKYWERVRKTLTRLGEYYGVNIEILF